MLNALLRIKNIGMVENPALSIALALALNAGFLIAANLTGTDRAWINLDYAIAVVLIAFGLPSLGLTLAALFLLTDALVLLGQLYPFPRLSDLLYLLKFTALASTDHLLLMMAVMVIFAGKLVTLSIAGKRITPLTALITLNILAASAWLLMSTSGDGDRMATYRKLEAPAIASQTSTLISMRSSAFLDQLNGDGSALNPGPDGASQPWFNQLGNEDRLLLIVVESWGSTNSPRVNETLLAPLISLSEGKYQSGEMLFHGFTIAGELRELCKLTPLHFDLRKTQVGFENCLPNKLQDAGYTTGAMHGATSLMYDRRHWYPRVGFQETTFFEDRIWPRRCYSFPGACDLDMLPVLEDFFSKPGKRFMYWLTLNTHAPYDLRDLRGPAADCTALNLPEETETCRLIRLQADFFAGLAEQLRHESLRDVDVIIVGDHAPNMLNLKEREENFRSGSVPWVRFKTPAQ